MYLQSRIKDISDTCCLALSYLFAGYHYQASDVPETDEKKEYVELCAFNSLIVALKNSSILDKDATVKDAEKLLSCIDGIKAKVEKKNIEKIADLPDGYSAVNFVYNGNNHWVLYKDRQLLYNSLENSQCFSYGKPTEARIITWS